MISGPRRATAQVREKLGGRTTSFIIILFRFENLGSVTGVVDSWVFNGFPDQLSRPSELGLFNEATSKVVVVADEVVKAWRLGAATKAEVPIHIDSKRTVSFIVDV